ncbi:MAG: RNA polymerase sigma factor, partial [Planctomycetota bacterium]
MTPPPTDELLAELPWLRRFAAGLVRSAADADDLVQDTLGEALTTRSGDRGAGDRPLRGLLGGIARNLARGRHRDARRRGEREVRHARDGSDEPAPGADAEAERLELLRALLAELRALPPAQRRAVTARYLDGLELAEIARRDGVRAATVRSQLARGLAALRGRLDAREGGRERWLSSLAPRALGPAV